MNAPTPYPEAARTLLRGTLLDAVDAQIRDRGWAATTMASIATAAGVSRQTVYNEFGSRPAVAEAYVRREIDALVRSVDDRVREHAVDPVAALRSAFELFLQAASDEPLVKTIVAGTEGPELLAVLTSIGRSVAVAHLSGLIGELWPDVADADARMLADTLVRLGISHAVYPSESPETAASEATRLLAPFVRAVTGRG